MDTFLLQGAAWDWSYLEDYLRFFITGVTILVRAVLLPPACLLFGRGWKGMR